MRPEMIRKYSRLALLFMAGMALGRFVIPLLEPMTIRRLSVIPHPGEKECHYGLIVETHVLGKLKVALGSPPIPGVVTWGSYEEGYLSLACREDKTLGDTIFSCFCE